MAREKSLDAIIQLKMRNAQDRYSSMLENWRACLPARLEREKAISFQQLIDELTEKITAIQNTIIDLAYNSLDEKTEA